MLSHHNLYFTPPPLFELGEEREKKKINQNDKWLVSSEAKPSHVENRPGTIPWVQKIGGASSSLRCNYHLKTKRNKECTHIYTSSETDNYLTAASKAFGFAMSELTASHVVYAVSGTSASTNARTCSQDARNASQNSSYLSSPIATATVKATITSYPRSTITS